MAYIILETKMILGFIEDVLSLQFEDLNVNGLQLVNIQDALDIHLFWSHITRTIFFQFACTSIHFD